MKIAPLLSLAAPVKNYRNLNMCIMHIQCWVHGTIEGTSSKGGQVPFENLGDHMVGIKHNFGT